MPLGGKERSQLTLLMIMSFYTGLPQWLLESIFTEIICHCWNHNEKLLVLIICLFSFLACTCSNWVLLPKFRIYMGRWTSQVKVLIHVPPLSPPLLDVL